MARTTTSPIRPLTSTPKAKSILVWVSAALLVLVGLGACGGSSDDAAGDDFDSDSVLDGALSGADDSDDQDDSADATDLLDPGSKSGLATLVIGGQTYEFFADGCTAELGSGFAATTAFGITGSGTAAGQPFGGFIQRTVRDVDGDGTDDVLHTIKIEVGQDNVLSQSDPGNPSLGVSLGETDEGNLSVGYEPGRLSGSGALTDRNGVLAPANDEIQFTFVATCV